LSEKAVSLLKVGHEVDMTYEVIRRQRVNQLAVHLRLIGRAMRRSLVDWALDIIVNGDGNSNPATVTTASGLTYANLVDFDLVFDDFEPTIWVTTKTGMGTILKMAEFKDPQAGFNYQKTGDMVSPLGVTLKRTVGGTYPAASTLIGIDKNAALEYIIEAGSQLVEAENIIDKQFKKIVISQQSGFSKIYPLAGRVWNWA
jgi:hypothetical protein